MFKSRDKLDLWFFIGLSILAGLIWAYVAVLVLR